MGIRFLVAASLASLILVNTAAAQPSGNSSANWVTAGPVHAVARSGSTVYLGGEFDAIAPKSHEIGSFARFQGFESGRLSCTPRINGSVRAIQMDDFGGFFVGGRFDRVNGVARENLAHIDRTCAVDLMWTGIVNGQINALSARDGVLYVGGSFSEGGQHDGSVAPRSNLAAFDVTTGLLTDWNPSANGEVHALEAYSPNTAPLSILVGGAFTELGGAPRARLGGVSVTGVATAFVADTDAPVRTLEHYRWLSDDATDHLWVGGEFTSIAGVPRNRIARVTLNSNNVDTVDLNADGTVRVIVVPDSSRYPQSTAYVGGDFTHIGGAPRNYAAAVSEAGLTLPFNPHPDGPVFAIASSFGRIYLGGSFVWLGHLLRVHGASVDGLSGAAEPWNPSFNGIVRAISAISDVVVGGDFNALGARHRRNLAAIDLDSGRLLPFAPDVRGHVNAMIVRHDTLYVGGDFTHVNSVLRNRLASFTAYTRILSAWNPNADGSIRALAWRGATIFAGGDFANIGSVARGRVAAIDATTGSATGWTPPDFDATVEALSLFDAFLYVGGLFTSAGGIPVTYLTRLDATTGARDATWVPSQNGEVRAICARPAVVYVGGVFTVGGGVPRTNLAAVDTAVGAATAWQPNPDGAVNALACATDVVYAGGAFATVGNATSLQIRPRLVGLRPGASGVTALYATSFRAWAVAVVEDVQSAADGVLAAASEGPLVDGNDVVNRLAFFPENFAGAPGAPASPAIWLVSDSSVRLRWFPPLRGPRPTSYLLEAGSALGLHDYARGIEVFDTQLQLNLATRVPVFVRIRAANAFGVSAPSEEQSFVTGFPCSGIPEAPDALTASSHGSAVTFSWRPNLDRDVARHLLEVGVASGRTDLVLTLPTIQSVFSIAAPSGQFFVRLRASGSCGTSLPSDEVTVVTSDLAAPPSAPFDLAASVSGSSTVSLFWSPPAVGTAAAYRVQAGTGFGWNDLGEVTITATGLTVSHVPSGTYYVRVFALGVSGPSPPSDELIVVVP
jgi:hypothetical protein